MDAADVPPRPLLPAALVAVSVAVPSAAAAQPTSEVVVRSNDAPPARPPGRVALEVSLGAGFGVAGATAGSLELGLGGAVSLGSLRGSVAITRAFALQVGGLGALWVAPSRSVSGSAQGFDLEGVSGFGLLGGGVACGAPGQGVRASVLGGVAWLRAPISGTSWTRSGAGLGGGVSVDLAHHWPLDGQWTLGLGATGWFLAGADRARWIDDSAPSWRSVGAGLYAAVSSR